MSPSGRAGGDVWPPLTAPRAAASQLAALAVLSALLSWYSPIDPWGVLSVFELMRRQELLPAIYFGLVLCAGIYLWESRNWKHIGFVFFAVLVSWVCAYQLAFSSQIDFLGNFAFVVSGFVGGFAGSLGTAVGVSLVSSSVCNRRFFARTTLIGFLAGGLLGWAPVSLLPLFIVWQPAIAASIAYGLVSSKTSRLHDSKVEFPSPSGSALIVIFAGTLMIVAVALFFRSQVDANQAARESSESAPTAIEDDAHKSGETIKGR
jgi:hypothetical protein